MSTPVLVRAEDSASQPEKSTIDRGLNFLQVEAEKWRQEKNARRVITEL